MGNTLRSPDRLRTIFNPRFSDSTLNCVRIKKISHLLCEVPAVVQRVVESGWGCGSEVGEAGHGGVQVLHPRHGGGDGH